MSKNLHSAMRWLQIVLTEGDLGKFDAQEWLDYIEKAHIDGVCLNSGGYMCFHDTKLKDQYIVKDPRYDDVFGYLTKECRKRGTAVICRTDAHAFRKDVLEAHPDWVARDKDGNPVPHGSAPYTYLACVIGSYGEEFMTPLHRELAANYDIDGIFCNRWFGSVFPCYCESCKKKFAAYSGGMEIPADLRKPGPEMMKYSAWMKSELMALFDRWETAIRKVNSHCHYITSMSIQASSMLELKKMADKNAELFVDYQGRMKEDSPIWEFASDGKILHAVGGKDKALTHMTSVGFEKKPRWKDAVQSEAEITAWLAEDVANNIHPWTTKFSAQIIDRRWMDTFKRRYNTYYQWEKYLTDAGSMAAVAVAYSSSDSMVGRGTDAAKRREEEEKGFYQVLLESRIPFDRIDAANLKPEDLAHYQCVIFPDTAVLSDPACETVAEYVKNGGTIIADLETSLYKSVWEKRGDFGLANVFGVHYGGGKVGPIKNSYICISPQTDNPLSDGFAMESRAIGTEYRTRTKADPDAKWESNPFHPQPSYPDLPMEEVYPRGEQADYEDVNIHRCGAGCAIYLPGDLGRCYHVYNAEDHRQILANLIKYGVKDAPVELSGQGLLDVTIYRNAAGLMIHLVNLTSINALKGVIKEILPVQNIRVSVSRRTLTAAFGTDAGLSWKAMESKGITVGETADRIEITVPAVEYHEMLVCEHP